MFTLLDCGIACTSLSNVTRGIVASLVPAMTCVGTPMRSSDLLIAGRSLTHEHGRAGTDLAQPTGQPAHIAGVVGGRQRVRAVPRTVWSHDPYRRWHPGPNLASKRPEARGRVRLAVQQHDRGYGHGSMVP